MFNTLCFCCNILMSLTFVIKDTIYISLTCFMCYMPDTRQTEWQIDRLMVGAAMGDEQQSCVSHAPQPIPLSLAEKHHSLCSLWANPPSEQGSKPKPFWQSAQEALGLMSKHFTAQQRTLKDPGRFMESFKVTAPWASCSLQRGGSGLG